MILILCVRTRVNVKYYRDECNAIHVSSLTSTSPLPGRLHPLILDGIYMTRVNVKCYRVQQQSNTIHVSPLIHLRPAHSPTLLSDTYNAKPIFFKKNTPSETRKVIATMNSCIIMM